MIPNIIWSEVQTETLQNLESPSLYVFRFTKCFQGFLAKKIFFLSSQIHPRSIGATWN